MKKIALMLTVSLVAVCLFACGTDLEKGESNYVWFDIDNSQNVGRKDENGDVVFETGREEIHNMIHSGVINSGMIPKVLGCLKAIDAGVKGVHIIDGRIPHCLLLEIFTKTGIGTLIKGSDY